MTDLRPIDITQREFPRRFRGFDPVEVKTFLETVADEVQRLLQALAARDERIEQLEAQLGVFEEQQESLRRALIAAQRVSEDIKANAEREAATVLKEATVKGEQLLEGAHLKLANLQAEIAELGRQRQLFRAQLRAVIQNQLDLLDADPDAPARRRGPQ
ncbi:MAG: DivIVA domain-containing protein [Candidatus Methylomirabilales bacterium]